MSDEQDDPRPYDPEELDDDVNSATDNSGDKADGMRAELKQQEQKLDELKNEVRTDDPDGSGELLRGMPRGVGTDNPSDIDDPPAPTHPAEPAP